MFALLAASLIATAQERPAPIYLDCTIVEATGADVSKWYPANVVADEDRVIRDGLTTGLVGFIVRPPATWAIDFQSEKITTPEESNAGYPIQEWSPSTVVGRYTAPAGSWFSFRYNRVNKRLTLTNAATQEMRQEWRDTTGGEMPMLITTNHRCKEVRL